VLNYPLENRDVIIIFETSGLREMLIKGKKQSEGCSVGLTLPGRTAEQDVMCCSDELSVQ